MEPANCSFVTGKLIRAKNNAGALALSGGVPKCNYHENCKERTGQQEGSSQNDQQPIWLTNKNGLRWIGGIIPALVAQTYGVVIDNSLLTISIGGVGV